MENGYSEWRASSNSGKDEGLGKTEPSVSEVVDEFIEDFHMGNIQIKKEASEEITTEQNQTMSVSNFLVQAIYNYEVCKDNFEARIEQEDFDFANYKQAEKECTYWLSDCFYWIIQLRTLDLIVETDSMKSQLTLKEKEIEQLKEQIDQLTQKNLDLRKLNDELNKILNNFGEHGNSSFTERKP